jgi:hypothetical protein
MFCKAEDFFNVKFLAPQCIFCLQSNQRTFPRMRIINFSRFWDSAMKTNKMFGKFIKFVSAKQKMYQNSNKQKSLKLMMKLTLKKNSDSCNQRTSLNFKILNANIQYYQCVSHSTSSCKSCLSRTEKIVRNIAVVFEKLKIKVLKTTEWT